MNQIERLQKNLSLLRLTCGMTVQNMADELDVNRQTISNLESGTNKMTKIQYLAIRSLFSFKINDQKDNEMLQYLLYYLVDHPDELDDEKRIKILEHAKILTAAIKGGASTKDVSNTFDTLVKVLGVAIASMAVSEILFEWIDDLFK